MGNSVHSNCAYSDRFAPNQIYALKRFFQDISSRCDKNLIQKDIFLRVFKMPGLLGERLFEVFDADGDGGISLSEFLNGLAIIIHGDRSEKTLFLFRMYDFDKDGYVTYSDVSTMLYCAAYGAHNYIARIKKQKTAESQWDELSEKSFSDINHDEYKIYVEELLNSAFRRRKRENLNYNEFKKFIYQNDHVLEILEDVFIFEDLSTDDANDAGAARRSTNGSARKHSNSPKLFRKTDTRTRRSLFTKAGSPWQSKSFRLGDIITPDSVKRRHIKPPQKTTVVEPLGADQISRDVANDVVLSLTHAFEHMHHFHHGANHTGAVASVGEKFQMPVSRYLVLHDSVLYVFKKKDSLAPLTTVWMNGCAVSVVDNSNRSNKYRFGFRIHFPTNNAKKFEKTYFAPNKNEYEMWVHALRVASESKNFHSLYTLNKKIGVGRHSDVYVCTKNRSARKYAVKVIDKGGMNVRGKESLRLEISILKLLHHPNIIHVRDVFEERHLVYIVMQLFEGGDLYDRIKTKGRYKEFEAKAVMWRLLDAVKHIHNMGIVHRDLKPENLMLKTIENDDKVAVGDFGLSKFISPDQKLNSPCGTLSYTAPEVLRNAVYGKEVDVWSLGVINYVLLSGELPFKSRDSDALLVEIFEWKLSFAGRAWQGISAEAIDLVRSLLNRDAKKRISVDEAINHNWFIGVNK